MRPMVVSIREHNPLLDPASGLADFLRVPLVVYANDRNYIPALEFDIKERLHPKKSPFFKRGELMLFTAWKDGKLAGRISAQVDHEHLKRYNDETGFFGFFDTIDDDEVGQALIRAAETWLTHRGMRKMRGPYSLTINDELGVLVDGFDTPNALMMNHSLPHQDRVAKSAGLEKAKDMFAWRYEVGKIPPRAEKAWAEIAALPEVKLRSINMRRLTEDLGHVVDIYNSAWSENWGYVPPTAEEAKKMVSDLRPFLDPDMAFIAELNGKPVGMCITLPNINEAIRDFGGKLNLINIAKLLYRIKVKTPKSARLMMLGIRSELRGQRRYAGLSHALYVEIARRGSKKGYQWGELSWTLEDNKPINLGIQSMGAKVYKTYRVYEKTITR